MAHRGYPFPRVTLTHWLVGIALALGGLLSRAAAMSVLPPTFPELVAESSHIAHVRVVSVASRIVASPDGQKVVKTFVTFSAIKTLKGPDDATFTLSFLGGTDPTTGERWVVPGMPEFQPDAEEFVFATSRESVCPLVGAMHGRYRVEADAASGRHYVTRDNRAPLISLGDVVQPMESLRPEAITPSTIALALGPADFESRIAAEVAHPTPSSPP